MDTSVVLLQKSIIKHEFIPSLMVFQYTKKWSLPFRKSSFSLPSVAKKGVLILVSVLGLGWQVSAQDLHFSQFYASPLTLNPALTGALNGRYRMAMIYRDQWNKVLDSPYSSTSAAIDLRMRIDSRKKKRYDAFGLGMVFYNDRVASSSFVNNQIHISGAFHKALSAKRDQFLSAGAQWGIAQRGLGYSNLVFDDQFNGLDGFTGASEEVFPANSLSFFDLSGGLHYSYAPARKTAVFAGLTFHHFREPQISFYYEKNQPDPLGFAQLPLKVGAHLGLMVPMGTDVQLLPRVNWQKQAVNQLVNAGTNIRFIVNRSASTALQLGVWGRAVTDINNTLGVESATLMTGLELKDFLIGFSYDVSLTQLKALNRPRGAFEISFSYLGEGNYQDDEGVLCPAF